MGPSHDGALPPPGCPWNTRAAFLIGMQPACLGPRCMRPCMHKRAHPSMEVARPSKVAPLSTPPPLPLLSFLTSSAHPPPALFYFPPSIPHAAPLRALLQALCVPFTSNTPTLNPKPTHPMLPFHSGAMGPEQRPWLAAVLHGRHSLGRGHRRPRRRGRRRARARARRGAAACGPGGPGPGVAGRGPAAAGAPAARPAAPHGWPVISRGGGSPGAGGGAARPAQQPRGGRLAGGRRRTPPHPAGAADAAGHGAPGPAQRPGLDGAAWAPRPVPPRPPGPSVRGPAPPRAGNTVSGAPGRGRGRRRLGCAGVRGGGSGSCRRGRRRGGSHARARPAARAEAGSCWGRRRGTPASASGPAATPRGSRWRSSCTAPPGLAAHSAAGGSRGGRAGAGRQGPSSGSRGRGRRSRWIA